MEGYQEFMSDRNRPKVSLVLCLFPPCVAVGKIRAMTVREWPTPIHACLGLATNRLLSRAARIHRAAQGERIYGSMI